MAKASVSRIQKKLHEKRVGQVRPKIDQVLESDPEFKQRLYRARFLMLEAEKDKLPSNQIKKLTEEFESLLRSKGLL